MTSVLLLAIAGAIYAFLRTMGRGYLERLFPDDHAGGNNVQSLLDVGYWLVAIAYALFNVEVLVRDALYSAAGLLLILGVAHILGVALIAKIADSIGARSGAHRPVDGGAVRSGGMDTNRSDGQPVRVGDFIVRVSVEASE